MSLWNLQALPRLILSHQSCASSWTLSIKLMLDRLWHTPQLEKFFSCQGGLVDGSVSQNIYWPLVHFSGGYGDSSLAQDKCCLCASAPLSFIGGWNGPAGSFRMQMPLGMAQECAIWEWCDQTYACLLKNVWEQNQIRMAIADSSLLRGHRKNTILHSK